MAILLGLTWQRVQQEQLEHALIAAVDRNNTELVRRLLRQGADPNAPVMPDDQRSIWKRLLDLLSRNSAPAPKSQESALMKAIEWRTLAVKVPDNVDTVQALVDAGANVNFRGGDYRWPGTPLITAAWSGKYATTKLLLDHQADVHEVGFMGFTALIGAARNAYPDLVEVILQRGANIHARDEDGRTPILHAVCYDVPSMNEDHIRRVRQTVACLLRHGAHADDKDHIGFTVMNLAQGWDDYTDPKKLDSGLRWLAVPQSTPKGEKNENTAQPLHRRLQSQAGPGSHQGKPNPH